MKKRNACVYPGTFDPVTLGHEDVIKNALLLFDTVHIAVYENPSKNPLFDIDTRISLLKASLDHDRVNIFPFYPGTLTIQVAREMDAKWLVRGLRVVSDFDEEIRLSMANGGLDATVRTVWFPCHQNHMHISSSLVREMILCGEDFRSVVSNTVYDQIRSLIEQGLLEVSR